MRACADLSNEHYGGRGIKMSEEFQNPELFCMYLDQLEGYTEGMELDRIDNDGDYEPGNVRWATKSDNRKNTRKQQ